jgi:hypothetical protein
MGDIRDMPRAHRKPAETEPCGQVSAGFGRQARSALARRAGRAADVTAKCANATERGA